MSVMFEPVAQAETGMALSAIITVWQSC